MKIRMGVFVVCWVLGWEAFRACGQAAEADGLLDEIRSAMAERDLNVAKAKLQEAARVSGGAAFDVQRQRLQSLYEYLEGFWESVDEGARSLQAVEELMIGDVRVAVVEYTPGLLVLRVKGENRRYTVKSLPAKVALTLAERVLKPDAPENKVFFGAFLAMDGKGDREAARKLWSEAQQAKVDVSALLPELGTAPPATLPVEIPPLTSIMRKLLAPANWAVRRQAEERVLRETLKKDAEQTAEGYLKLALPSDAGAAQVVYSRKLTGSFVCRVILKDVAEGQVFGLFGNDALDAAYQVPLPKGAMMIEFARQAGAFQCRLNQKEVPVESRGDVTPTMPGMIGLTVPAGSPCVVAWFELQGR
ncbi:MAG: hypothetical protein GX575_26040 [Candidatus Anammoximicrobium sp.]|nr:hypothetical protein [Candidatus Anammoximicrobium sp.]